MKAGQGLARTDAPQRKPRTAQETKGPLPARGACVHACTCAHTHARTRTPQSGLSTEHWVRRTLNPPQDATAPSWGGNCAVIKRLDRFSARLGSAQAPPRRPLPRLFSSCVLLSAGLGLWDRAMPSPQEPPAAPAPLSAWQSARQPCRPGCRLRPVGASPCKHLHFVCGWRADESPAPQRGSAPGFRGPGGRLRALRSAGSAITSRAGTSLLSCPRAHLGPRGRLHGA